MVGPVQETRHTQLLVRDCNWVSIAEPAASFKAEVKIRSASMPVKAEITPDATGQWKVFFADGVTSAAAGQSAVFYDGELLLGGGIIESVQ